MGQLVSEFSEYKTHEKGEARLRQGMVLKAHMAQSHMGHPFYLISEIGSCRIVALCISTGYPYRDPVTIRQRDAIAQDEAEMILGPLSLWEHVGMGADVLDIGVLNS